jgi:hypothetical protein
VSGEHLAAHLQRERDVHPSALEDQLIEGCRVADALGDLLRRAERRAMKSSASPLQCALIAEPPTARFTAGER